MFGEELQIELPENPWRFASKRFDSDLNLVHFGKRDYDPKSGRWLTRDPAGFVDSVNLYQYVFNNPFYYCDPDGQFAFAIPLVWIIGGAISLPTIKAVLGGALVVGIIHQAHKLYQNRNTKEQADSPGNTLWKDNAEAEEKEKKKREPVVIDVYAPDRPLPRDSRTKEPVPDTDAPHTQLGTRKSERGGYKYPQAREFDGNGKPVRGADFTDHARDDHPVPHQHRYIPNNLSFGF